MTRLRSRRRPVSTLPIEREARHLFYSEPIKERILEPLVVSAERHFAAKQLADGRILASDLAAVGEPEDGRAEWLGNVRAVAGDLLPQLTYVSFSILVTGFYDVTPDHQPILGAVEGLPGLYLAAGFSGHGFMLAPAVGRRIAGAVLGGPADNALEAVLVRAVRSRRPATRARHRLTQWSTRKAPVVHQKEHEDEIPKTVDRPGRRSRRRCSSPPSRRPQRPPRTTVRPASSTLVIDKSFDLKTSDPQRQYEPTGGIVDRGLYDTLLEVRGRRRGAPGPERRNVVQGVEGRKTYTFTLRKNVKFSDGTPLTSADVVFSFNRLVNLKGNPSFLLAGITTSAKGKYTVVLHVEDAEPGDPGARREHVARHRQLEGREGARRLRRRERRQDGQGRVVPQLAVRRQRPVHPQELLDDLAGRAHRATRTTGAREAEVRERRHPQRELRPTQLLTSSAARTRSRSTSRADQAKGLEQQQAAHRAHAVGERLLPVRELEPEGLGDQLEPAHPERDPATRSTTTATCTLAGSGAAQAAGVIPSMFLGALQAKSGDHDRPRRRPRPRSRRRASRTRR